MCSSCYLIRQPISSNFICAIQIRGVSLETVGSAHSARFQKQMLVKVNGSKYSSFPPLPRPGLNRKLGKMTTMSKPVSTRPHPNQDASVRAGEGRHPAFTPWESSCTGWLKNTDLRDSTCDQKYSECSNIVSSLNTLGASDERRNLLCIRFGYIPSLCLLRFPASSDQAKCELEAGAIVAGLALV